MTDNSQYIRPRIHLDDAVPLKSALHEVIRMFKMDEVTTHLTPEELRALFALECKVTELLIMAEARAEVKKITGKASRN